MMDNQPRYTTKRLHDEIDKAKAYARREALEEAEAVVADYAGKQSPIAAAIRALQTPTKAGGRDDG